MKTLGYWRSGYQQDTIIHFVKIIVLAVQSSRKASRLTKNAGRPGPKT